MNRYQPKTPRAAFGVAAVAMTALTLALAIVAPAKLAPVSQDAAMLAAAGSGAPAAVEVLIVPARIQVIGVRESTVAADVPAAARAKGRQQG